MTHKKPSYSTKGASPLGQVATINGQAMRMVTANHNKQKALERARSQKGAVRSCIIDGKPAYSVWYPVKGTR